MRVVGEGQVGTAGEQIDAGPERAQSHRGALGVPARPPPPPGTGPGGVTVPGRSPHGHVERVVAQRVVGLVAVLRRQGQRSVPADPGPLRHIATAEEDVTVPLVGFAGGEQRHSELDDVGDVVPGAGLVGRPAYAQQSHVLLEEILLAQRELVVVPAVLPRRPSEDVVDVGHVPAGAHLDTAHPDHRRRYVRPDEGCRMPEVRHVVRCDPADVQPGRADQRQPAPGQPQLRAPNRAVVRSGDPAGLPDHT